VNEAGGACTVAGGPCDAALATLRACYQSAIPGFTDDQCPIGVVPAYRGCTPASCQDPADAFDACVFGCGDVQKSCFVD
jgi:hypothetical protein